MITWIKKSLFNLIGLKLYLKILHKSFYFYYNYGFLKSNPIYKYHYFVKKLISQGDVVIDIGANLGYYTKNFSQWVGEKGHVYSVEPVKPFYETLQWAMNGRNNVTLYNFALGKESQDIELVLPKYGGLFRSGLAHIPQNEEVAEDSYRFQAKMTHPEQLFGKLEVLHYIKCDIEGFESVVIPLMKPILEKHKPLLQIETGGHHKEIVDKVMLDLDYVEYTLKNQTLVKVEENTILEGDCLYIPKEKIAVVLNKIA